MGDVTIGNRVCVLPMEGWDGTADVTASWRLGWDGTNLYIAVEVLDDVHVQAGDAAACIGDGGGGSGSIKVAEAGGLDSGVTDAGDGGDGAGEVFLGEVTQRPELEGGAGRSGHKGGSRRDGPGGVNGPSCSGG